MSFVVGGMMFASGYAACRAVDSTLSQEGRRAIVYAVLALGLMACSIGDTLK